MSKLSKIKAGKKNYKLVNFPGTEEKVALAILTSLELTEAKTASDREIEEKGIDKEDSYADIIFQKHIIYRALRDKDDISKRLASSLEELEEIMDNQEIGFLMVEYNMMNQEMSPFLSTMTEEHFEELKKTLPKMNWNDLNGQSLVALRNFLVSLAS